MEAYEQLEYDLANWSGTQHVVACSSGTAALHLALETLQLPQGAEVIVPDFTMVSCARAVVLAGMKPVFVDCTNNLLMDLDLVELCLEQSPRACVIMPVHVYGRRCDMDTIARLANRYEVYVVEDLAEAHGVKPHPASDAACWSFYKNKVVHGEEGGAVSFKSAYRAKLARSLRCVGFTENHDFSHVPRGHNYRMANCLASLVSTSLLEVKDNLAQRRVIEGWYDETCPEAMLMPPRDVPWVYDVRVGGMTVKLQDVLVEALNLSGVAARHGFKRMTSQPEFASVKDAGGNTTKPASKSWLVVEDDQTYVSNEVVYLPIQPGVTSKESVRKAFEVINRVLA